LTIECDELWSFVQNKVNQQWGWLALDVDTQEIVGVYVGACDATGVQGLWDSLSPGTGNAPSCTLMLGRRMPRSFPSTPPGRR